MNTAPLVDLLRDLRRDLGAETNGLTPKELAWRPHPNANSIGVTVWHVARWLDMLNFRVLCGMAPADEIWHRDGWAHRTNYDPRGVGTRGWGVVTGYTVEEVARIPILSAEDFVQYLNAVAAALETTLSELSPDDLLRPARGFPEERSSYDWIRSVITGALGHLGEIRAMRSWQR